MSSGRIPSVEGGIQPTIVDAKGDLIVATAADTVSRLAVGSNDQVLTADSSTATGLKWATPAAGSLTLLSTTSISGTTTTVSSINQNYTHLFVVIYGLLNDTNNGRLELRPNGQTGGTRTANVYGSASSGTVSYSGAGYVLSGGVDILRTDSNNIFTFTIYDYANTSVLKLGAGSAGYTMSTGAAAAAITSGYYASTDAITSLVVRREGDNMTAGTIKIYGVK